MSNTIPHKLIDAAERAVACNESLKRLIAKPRTFRGLVRKNTGWAWWAIDHLAPRKIGADFIRAAAALDQQREDKFYRDYRRLLLKALESAFSN